MKSFMRLSREGDEGAKIKHYGSCCYFLRFLRKTRSGMFLWSVAAPCKDNTGRHPHLVATENNGQLNIVDLTRLALIERSATVRFMPEESAPFVEEAKTFTADEVTRRSLRAMRKAFADVVLENKAWGLPVIQWRDDRGMVEVPAEQLEPLARRILEVDGDPLPPEEERALLAHLKI